MAFLQSDQDYLDAGVDPPEHIPHGADTIVADQHIHRWRQIGNFIECDGGHHVHGQPFDHLNNILAGTASDGRPIFKRLDLEANKSDDGDNVSPGVSNEG